MAGPLSSERPTSDTALTGGSRTTQFKEANQDATQVSRSDFQDRPTRTGRFSVSSGAAASAFGLNRGNTRSVNNLRTKSSFKRKKLRK